MQSELNTPESDYVWRQLAPHLEAAMSRLGASDRTLLALRFYENKTGAEAAVLLGIGEEAAHKRTSRALEKLHRYFSQHGISSTTQIIAGAISGNATQTAPAAMAGTVTIMALAKGATASASTAALIHGALKVMTWTKTKTTIVTAIVLLLAGGSTFTAVKVVRHARQAATLASSLGSWEGALQTNSVQLRLVLKIFKTNDVYRATLDSIDQGVKDIPVAGLTAEPGAVHLLLPALGADYVGTLSADKSEMSGTFKQMNVDFPLTLKRTDHPDQVVEAMPVDAYAPRAGSDLQGAWAGVIKLGKAELHLNLRIAEPTSGTFSAQVDSVDQGARNLSVDALTYNKPGVRFEMKSIDSVYEGALNNQHDQITGNWTQLGKKYPVSFHRVQTDAQAAEDTQKDYGQGNPSEVQGHWRGALNLKGVTLRLLFHIARSPDGSYSATLDSPDQGAAGIPASGAEFTYPQLKLEWQAMNGVYTGTLEHNRLSGTWRQGTVSFSLKMERTTAN